MYYYFIDTKDGALVFQREATEKEFEELKKHIYKISDMQRDNNRIRTVNQKYDEFTKQLASLGQAKSFYDYAEIQSSLSNYLFHFKKYLDNWETHLSRSYGQSSTEYKCFKTAQAFEYDNHIEYRFMYRLRNFDQHCGNIISQISSSIDENNKQQHKIFADRDSLLRDFDEWKIEEVEYIKQQDAFFDLYPIIKQFQACIVRIQDKIMQIHFKNDFFESCAQIIIAANEFKNEEDISIVVNEKQIDSIFWDSPGQKKLAFTRLDVKTCKQLIELYVKKKFRVIKVLYFGEKYHRALRQCAVAVDNNVVHKISATEYMTFNGQKMIRALMHLAFDAEEFCAVLVDSHFNSKEIREIQSLYSLFLKAFCKK